MGMDWVKGEMSNKHWYDIIKIRGDPLFRALQRKSFGHRVCLLFSTLTHVSGCSKKKNGCVSKEAPTKTWNSAPLVSLFSEPWSSEAEEQGQVLRNASLTPKHYSGSRWSNIYYVSDTVRSDILCCKLPIILQLKKLWLREVTWFGQDVTTSK